MPHCRPCLLVWCFSVGHAFCVMPLYRPWRLAWYLIIGHACWSIATATDILLVECRWKKHGYNSVATLIEVPLHQTWLLFLSHSQICLFVQSTLSDRHAGFIYLDTCVCKVIPIRQDIWSVTNPQDMPTGKIPLPQVCKTCKLPFWRPSGICQILSDAAVASLGCYKDIVCN